MKKTKRIRVAVLLGLAYIAVCAVIDLGIQGALIKGITFLIGLCIVVGIAFNLIHNFTVVLVPIFFFTMWLVNTGTRHPVADLSWALIIFCVAFITWIWFLWGRPDRKHSRWNAGIWIIATLAIWIGCSLTDKFFERNAQPKDINRYIQLREKTPWQGLKVGVTLSGGGYRAALMHAGTLDALERLGVVPTHLSAVSGGAIIASYYAAEGKPEDVLNAVLQERLLLKRELTSFPNTLMLICPLHLPWADFRLLPFCDGYTRTDIQAKLIDRVFLNGINFRDISDTNHPKLMIGSTDLITGDAVGLTSDGIVMKPIQRGKDKYVYSNNDLLDQVRDKRIPGLIGPAFLTNITNDFPLDTKLARLVAASGAFPGAFPSVSANINVTSGVIFDRRRDIEKIMTSRSLALADGGLSDNTGIMLLLDANAAAIEKPDSKIKDWKTDVVIVSNAEMGFHTRPELNSLSEKFSQVADIIYANTGVRKANSSDPSLWLVGPYIFDNHRFWDYLRKASKLSPESLRKSQVFIPIQGPGSPLSESLFSLLKKRIPLNNPEVLDVLREIDWKGKAKIDKWKKILLSPNIKNVNKETVESELLVDFSSEIVDGVERFDRFSTLSDQIAADDAKALYRLGQFLILLDWSGLRMTLDKACDRTECKGYK